MPLFTPAAKVEQETMRDKQLSTVAIVGFQFGLYHVVAPLSFKRSISLASLFVMRDSLLSRACFKPEPQLLLSSTEMEVYRIIL